MPRCYMVKKQSSNKYQSTVMRDCWDQTTTTTTTSPTITTASSSAAASAAATVVAPESPTEGCVAPPCYTPLTNRSSYSQDFVPNGTVEKNSLLQSVRSEDITSGSDGEIPIFRTRSAEETEAAHDLLSLSQSLPPLPAPSVVMIHQTVPNEDEPLSPNHCYRPLSPDPATQPKYNKRTITPPPPPPTTVTVPCYTPPIVYVVQVPAAVPTPPTSECSSDAENLQICGSGGGGGGHPTVQHHQTLSDNHNDDILILPLSPEPDSHLGGISVQETLTTTASAATTTATHHSNIVSTTENGSPVTQETVIASSHLNIPDRRKRKNKRTNKTNKTYKNNNDNSTADNNIDSISDDAASKTKFYKVVADDPEELSDNNTETTDPTSDSSIPITAKASRYVCGECGKQYATSSNLSRHKQTHRSLDSQSAKKCMTCGKAYVSMPALAMHLLTHKLAHGCGICGKQFSRPWLLQGHLRSHTGEKPYGCAHCGKAFADRSNLRAHMQTHSGDKNFSCPKCHKTFALKSYLNKHQESACMVWDAKMKSYKRMTVQVHAETQTVTVG